jgi:hypothetical protein
LIGKNGRTVGSISGCVRGRKRRPGVVEEGPGSLPCAGTRNVRVADEKHEQLDVDQDHQSRKSSLIRLVLFGFVAVAEHTAFVVCHLDTNRTPTGPETPPSVDEPHLDDTRYVFVVRMYTRRNRRGYVNERRERTDWIRRGCISAHVR